MGATKGITASSFITRGSSDAKKPSDIQEDPSDAQKQPSIQFLSPQHPVSPAIKTEVTNAEILWALKVIESGFSQNSCSNINILFQKMFPDSVIASKFQLGRQKCSYIINHGLGPYFSQQLCDDLKKCSDFVVLFDESLNKISQRGQMDVFIRYFDNKSNKVFTRYYGSSFLGHAKADDLVENFYKVLKELPKENMLQISMDGPNVNLSFLSKVDQDIKVERPLGKHLIEIGICSLHAVNGSLKCALLTVKWDIHLFLRDVYYLLNDSPARRADYTAITESTTFPLKYCTIRWLENVKCIERCLTIFENLECFIKNAKLPNTKPVMHLRKSFEDNFLKAKLSFCKMVSLECEPFLRRFQSNKPLCPFLYSSLETLLSNLMCRFVKSKVIAANKLTEIDLDKKENLIDPSKVDIGFSTKTCLKKMNSSMDEVTHFKGECLIFLIAFVKKLTARSPLKHPLTKGLSCLDPKIILNSPEVAKARMNILLSKLLDSNRISEVCAECAKSQFRILCQSTTMPGSEKLKMEHFISSNSDEMGLDTLYSDLISSNPDMKDLWQVIKLSLIISHGNAAVEGGFSINKSLLIENLLEESLIAQRHVKDAIDFHRGIQNIMITNKLFFICQSI